MNVICPVTICSRRFSRTFIAETPWSYQWRLAWHSSWILQTQGCKEMLSVLRWMDWYWLFHLKHVVACATYPVLQSNHCCQQAETVRGSASRPFGGVVVICGCQQVLQQHGTAFLPWSCATVPWTWHRICSLGQWSLSKFYTAKTLVCNCQLNNR